MMESSDAQADYLQQLRWRSRRGLLELELLLLPFARDRLDALSVAELQSYEQLLACEDLDIYDWLQLRSQPAEPSLQQIVELIRAHQRSSGPL
jgi:antitoxin CptB